ncbi:MAG TPA: phosphate ABC transporter substrate-binding protein PstS [Rhizomicrobium sp.]|jgi:phosphate transport system substrate-binding protein|nr:phosphate ABC transporter substrate-binding protein PstS [Rhizomicrobium sp.]
MKLNKIAGVIGALALGAFAEQASAAEISGAGATFPYPIYAKWAAAYKGVSGVGLNYQSIGSGGGIAQIKAKTVTFGASDMPLKPKDLDEAGLVMFPTVVGAEVMIYNVPGIPSNTLVLDGPTIADIYLGKVAKWNDAEIKKLNPSVNLPDKAITVVHRSDGSGTTFIFANYLSKVSKDWASKVGAGTAVDWPVGIGAKGNEGVAGNVAQTAGAIGYVEYAYAMQSKLRYTKLKNHDGQVVSPTMESFQSSAANADWDHADHFYMILTDQPGAKSWPIENPTFILMHKDPVDKAASAETLKFFKWAYEKGDKMAESLLYIPLPNSVVQKIEASWKQIQGSGM